MDRRNRRDHDLVLGAVRSRKPLHHSLASSSLQQTHADSRSRESVDDAVQLFGAEGVLKGSVVERLYREVRALRIYEGTTEIQKLILARHIRQEYENA